MTKQKKKLKKNPKTIRLEELNKEALEINTEKTIRGGVINRGLRKRVYRKESLYISR